MSALSSVLRRLHHLIQPIFTIITLAAAGERFLRPGLRSSTAPAAEILFLRKQLALYEERQVKPAQATNATRIAMVCASGFSA